jgi:hypothetical protein
MTHNDLARTVGSRGRRDAAVLGRRVFASSRTAWTTSCRRSQKGRHWRGQGMNCSSEPSAGTRNARECTVQGRRRLDRRRRPHVFNLGSGELEWFVLLLTLGFRAGWFSLFQSGRRNPCPVGSRLQSAKAIATTAVPDGVRVD